jgi:hypothetical protein
MKKYDNLQQFSNYSALLKKVDEVLQHVSDKEWNYSRITLQLRPLAQVDSPYLLCLEQVDAAQQGGKTEIAQLKSEITWGCRHGEELGILEIISLRLNKALLEHTEDEFWSGQRPVVRVVKKQELENQGIAEAFWYRVEEVGGEDFDNR